MTTARLYPAGDTLDERLDTLGRVMEMMPGASSVNASGSPERGCEAGDVVGRDPAAATDDPCPLVDPPTCPGDEVVDIDLDEAPVGHLEVPALRVGAEPDVSFASERRRAPDLCRPATSA